MELKQIHLQDLRGKLSQSQGELSRDQADLRQRQKKTSTSGKVIKVATLNNFQSSLIRPAKNYSKLRLLIILYNFNLEIFNFNFQF